MKRCIKCNRGTKGNNIYCDKCLKALSEISEMIKKGGK